MRKNVSGAHGLAALLVLATPTAALAQTDKISPFGSWHGAAQFEFAANGEPVPDAHRLLELVLEIKADGVVQGAVDEVGCRVAGLAKVAELAVVDLDVSLSGCLDPRFNARFTGRLQASGKEAKFQLDSFKAPLPVKVEQASISAMLHR